MTPALQEILAQLPALISNAVKEGFEAASAVGVAETIQPRARAVGKGIDAFVFMSLTRLLSYDPSSASGLCVGCRPLFS